MTIVAQSDKDTEGNVILRGAQVGGKPSDTTIIASGGIAALAVNVADDKYDRVYNKDKGTFRSKTDIVEDESKQSLVAGSSINGQNVLLQAGKTGADGQLVKGQGDITLQGSGIDAESQATLNAGRDITVTTGQAEIGGSHFESHTRKGFSASFMSGIAYGKSNANSTGEGTKTSQIASSVSGANVQMQAGRDANVIASSVVADENIDISAGRNLNLLAARDKSDSQSESHSSSTTHGLAPGLSGSLTIHGKNDTRQRGTEKLDDAGTSLISANGINQGGNAILRAGTDEQYKGTGEGNVIAQGANLLAKERLSISGNAVHLEAVDNTRDSTYHMDSKSLTLGARPAGVLGGLVNTVTDAINKQSNGASDRLAAASALKAGYDVYKFVDSGRAAAVMDTIGKGSKDPTQAGIGVSISINSSKSSQDSETHINKQRGTDIQAANLDISANEGDITMKSFSC